MNVALDDVFWRQSREYQSRPVKAAKYQCGMENGFMVYCCNTVNSSNECVRFFPNKKEAWNYINENPKHYIRTIKGLQEVDVIYNEPEPVLYRRWKDGEDREDIFAFGAFAITDNESSDYECKILYDTSWIIIESDGSIRVWYPDSEEDFFGENYICEKKNHEEYVEITV